MRLLSWNVSTVFCDAYENCNRAAFIVRNIKLRLVAPAKKRTRYSSGFAFKLCLYHLFARTHLNHPLVRSRDYFIIARVFAVVEVSPKWNYLHSSGVGVDKYRPFRQCIYLFSYTNSAVTKRKWNKVGENVKRVCLFESVFMSLFIGTAKWTDAIFVV